jgi:DnaK suppressor protein
MATKDNAKAQSKTEENETGKVPYEPYRKILLKRREELCASVKSHAEELPDTGISGSTGDSSDQATADYASELFGALLERQSGTLEEVEYALEKMKNGEYGVCEMCEKNIPLKRIKALPWARFCLECQQKHDKQRNAVRRSSM